MSDSERHAMKMAKKKAARDKIMATKTDEKGLIVIHTGKGKGKSSAAFGMIFRHIAHDMQCAVVQFIKGGMSTGERDLILGKFSDICSFHTMGEGFHVGNPRPRSRHRNGAGRLGKSQRADPRREQQNGAARRDQHRAAL